MGIALINDAWLMLSAGMNTYLFFLGRIRIHGKSWSPVIKGLRALLVEDDARGMGWNGLMFFSTKK
jgi:hypothetical protein